MPTAGDTVVGIDVGGERKGFHAVAFFNGRFVDKVKNADPGIITTWCIIHKAKIVAVDAPCLWSLKGSSRLVERELNIAGEKIHCFATPTREKAISNKAKFYDWVLNGEKLYKALESNKYPLFNYKRTKGNVCIETFPHAVVCAMAGQVIPAKPKLERRRDALEHLGLDITDLNNIDFLDAALCAVAANEFLKGKYHAFGDRHEGFIVVPAATPGF